jgi:pantetheine-phosphate adenylyltransferase
MRVAVYPGSFDPFTNGHLDILDRASRLFDHVIIGVLVHPEKKCLFSPEERVNMITDILKEYENVRAIHFNGLLVDFCKNVGACAIVRGLRAVSDYEYELQMYSVNRRLSEKVETVFLMSSPEYSFLSSSIAKEVARYKGSVKGLVPEIVRKKMEERFK